MLESVIKHSQIRTGSYTHRRVDVLRQYWNSLLQFANNDPFLNHSKARGRTTGDNTLQHRNIGVLFFDLPHYLSFISGLVHPLKFVVMQAILASLTKL